MDYFITVSIRIDPEFNQNTVMNITVTRLHQYLIANRGSTIGISFPEYNLNPRTLGNQLRLHGKKTDLQNLIDDGWLKRMQDYIFYEEIEKIPPNCSYINVRRIQAKSNPERLARRYARRHNISITDALIRYKDFKTNLLKYPFLTLNSQSTSQQFNLFIQQSKPHKENADGDFNKFGLSKVASLPWF